MPFRWVREDRPGECWQRLFRLTWPSYRRWFLQEGDARRPSLVQCTQALEQHMPELVPVWEELRRLADDDPQAARMLALYRPAPYMAGCSQAVWLRGEPLLVRNYDYDPSTCEGLFLLSRWSGTRVLASSDCLWGALDGMNEHGLVVALAFGGRSVVGDGFGIPLLVRYALETCTTTAEAVGALCRVPIHMAYNVTVLDAAGVHACLELAPDRAPVVSAAAVVTNRQRGAAWPEYEQRARSEERRLHIEELLAERMSAEAFAGAFLRSPLFATDYARSFGTLYTAVYAPRRRSVRFLWQDALVEQSLDDFQERDLVIPFVAVPVPEVGA